MRSRSAAGFALIVALALPASAADYPTKPDDMDKLCEVIGEAPNLSVPPKDRLWFKENCSCVGGSVGCGNITSDRFGQRLATAKAALEAKEKTDAAAKAAKERKAAEAKAAKAAKEDAYNRSHPDEVCPRLRHQLTNDEGNREATQLFKKYCTEWAIETDRAAAEREKQEAASREAARIEEARQQAEREQRAETACSPYLKCLETRDVHECRTEVNVCFDTCNAVAVNMVFPPACLVAHKAKPRK